MWAARDERSSSVLVALSRLAQAACVRLGKEPSRCAEASRGPPIVLRRKLLKVARGCSYSADAASSVPAKKKLAVHCARSCIYSLVLREPLPADPYAKLWHAWLRGELWSSRPHSF